jgi:hypothetical protein
MRRSNTASRPSLSDAGDAHSPRTEFVLKNFEATADRGLRATQFLSGPRKSTRLGYRKEV